MSWDSTTNDFFEALAEVAGPGVKVRLMFDHIGTARIPGYRELVKKLDETKIEWHPMLPIQPLKGRWRRPDLRNHRKIVVVDGRIAFVGSLNMIDASYHNPKHERAGPKWRELVMQINGPAVFSLDVVFCHRLVPRDQRGAARRCSATHVREGARRCALPGRAEWTRLPR